MEINNQAAAVDEKKTKLFMMIGGYPIEGVSIGRHETCIIIPSLNLASDIGRCPQRPIFQDFLFISNAHMDQIGGLPMYVTIRGLYSMKPPAIFVPKSIIQDVQGLFNVHRRMDQSDLNHNLIGLDVGEEFELRRDLKVRAFKTYHRIQSQGYVVYSVKKKLKQEYLGEVAFTGDTTSDFITDDTNVDALRIKVLVVEVEHARDYGHTHMFKTVGYADKFENKAILLIHFSARYTVEEIKEAVSVIPSPLNDRVFALTEGF